MHLFFPESHDLKRVNEMVTTLQHMVALEPNLFRNFDLRLGGYFERRSEVALAFLHRVFERLSEQPKREATASTDTTEAEALYDDSEAPNDSTQPKPLREAEISSEAVYDATLAGAQSHLPSSPPTEGNVWMARDFWTFQEVVYLSRLFEKMLARKQLASGKVRLECSPRAFMNSLIDRDAKQDKTMLRDRVCDAILRKRSVLSLLEQHAYHIFTQSEPNKPRRVSPLLDFAVLYEIEQYEGTTMKKEEYEKMVQQATWLGNNIADGVVQAMRDGESPGRAKGAFFRLRKTRTTKDFLAEDRAAAKPLPGGEHPARGARRPCHLQP